MAQRALHGRPGDCAAALAEGLRQLSSILGLEAWYKDWLAKACVDGFRGVRGTSISAVL